MYEQQEVPLLRRIILIVIWALAIIAVLWVAVWLVFFRGKGDNTEPASKRPQQAQQKQPDTGGADRMTSGSDRKETGGSTPTAPSSPSTPQAAPDRLADTGAGDMVIPVSVGVVGGSAAYYIYIRRKTVQ